jgi:uncharacterized protein YqeY
MITKQTLEDDLKEAIRSGDNVKKRTLRMVISTVKLAEVDKQSSLSSDELLGIIQKEVKSRQETIDEAEEFGRQTLVDSTQAEIDLLHDYLPEALTQEELEEIVLETINETGASGPQDMGNVMKAIMPKIRGRADGKAVSALVQQKLSAA